MLEVIERGHNNSTLLAFIYDMKINFALLSILFPLSVSIVSGQNIIQNGDFEGFDRWAERVFCEYSDAEYFTFYVDHWNTPKLSSPDYFSFNPKRRCNLFPLKPHSGYAHLGLTINNSIGFREIINNILKEPLVKGQTYYIEYWTAPFHKEQKIYPGAEKGRGTVYHKSDGFQIHFHTYTDETSIHLLKPKVNNPHVEGPALLDIKRGEWYRVSSIYEADDTYTHMLFGNLTNQITYSEKEYEITFPSNIELSRESYYYFDDFFMAKALSGYQSVNGISMDPYRTVNSSDLLFPLGKADVTPEHINQVDDVWVNINQDKIININIRGYTDNSGSKTVNDSLSNARAMNVKDQLISNGYPADKITVNAFGSEVAKASNDTEEGRKYNRRVEITFNVENELSQAANVLFDKYEANDRSKMTGNPLVITHNHLDLNYPAKALIYSSNESDPEQVIDIKNADAIEYGLFKSGNSYRVILIGTSGQQWRLNYIHK